VCRCVIGFYFFSDLQFVRICVVSSLQLNFDFYRWFITLRITVYDMPYVGIARKTLQTWVSSVSRLNYNAI